MLSKATLAPGKSITVTSLYGQAESIDLLPVIAKKVSEPGYAEDKLDRVRELINDLTSAVETHTSNHFFNNAIKQNYLDNSLRGSMPLILGEVDDDAHALNANKDRRLKVYHIFSRIHGNLERDYNDFNINPTFFSQGPRNYRDVAQNRWNDVVFTPRMGLFVIRQFLLFIQANGYKPLTVEAVAYMVEDHVLLVVSRRLWIVDCCLSIVASWSLGVDCRASRRQRSRPTTIDGVVALSRSSLGFLSVGCVEMS
jgi:hypothetical protein